MIRNHRLLESFEKKLMKKEKLDIRSNFRIVDALYHEAVELGAIPMKDPLEGIETDIKVAKVVNSV